MSALRRCRRWSARSRSASAGRGAAQQRQRSSVQRAAPRRSVSSTARAPRRIHRRSRAEERERLARRLRDSISLRRPELLARFMARCAARHGRELCAWPSALARGVAGAPRRPCRVGLLHRPSAPGRSRPRISGRVITPAAATGRIPAVRRVAAQRSAAQARVRPPYAASPVLSLYRPCGRGYLGGASCRFSPMFTYRFREVLAFAHAVAKSRSPMTWRRLALV